MATHLDAESHRLVGRVEPGVPHAVHRGKVLLDVLKPDASGKQLALVRTCPCQQGVHLGKAGAGLLLKKSEKPPPNMQNCSLAKRA